jgi:two-component system sensor histidine kinase DesK
LLAVVLREATANVLRHSSARTCRIQTWLRDGTAGLLISNDGAADANGTSGSGLRNLQARVGKAGGVLSVDRHAPGRFTLVVDIPIADSCGAQVSAEDALRQRSRRPAQFLPC